ncbi:hypothetical protein E1B28_004544 [Marasmius oreades]|uniref:Uncharacterized protein n=1 Tax=Marasmius oreades TaxID=181124 RepID=A0A9P8AD65_9AGAR|nr:uncharacterized protein E1B28_004544 [Marasmius oreades]KAG7097168.1 hypothetical protein E1B28_004544 [Marasmius oreades]
MESPPTTSTSPPEPREPESSTISVHESSSPRRSYPAIVHFTVLAAVTLPLTLVPYIFTRRRLSTLRQSIKQLETNSTLLRKELSSTSSELGRVRDDVRRMRGLLHEVMEETEGLRTDVRQREATQKAADDATRSELREISNVARISQLHGGSLRMLGLSLAEIAAFMHENELRMPLLGKRADKSRVDQIRSVALKLQDLPCVPEEDFKNRAR